MYYLVSVPTQTGMIIRTTNNGFQSAREMVNTIKEANQNVTINIKEVSDLTLLKRSKIYEDTLETKIILWNLILNDIFIRFGGDTMKINQQPIRSLA